MIICLGREFGSGGHEIGKQLAGALEVPFYDRQLVDMAIQRSESISEVMEKADEKRPNSFLYRVWYETLDKVVRKTDKQRKAYYDYYTGGSWGKPDNYGFCINSSALEREQMVQMLKAIVEGIWRRTDTES